MVTHAHRGDTVARTPPWSQRSAGAGSEVEGRVVMSPGALPSQGSAGHTAHCSLRGASGHTRGQERETRRLFDGPMTAADSISLARLRGGAWRQAPPSGKEGDIEREIER